MPRVASGSSYERAGVHYARVTIGPGDRRSYALPTCRTEEEADARAEVLAAFAKDLRVAGKGDQAQPVLERAAKCDAAALETVRKFVASVCAGRYVPIGGVVGPVSPITPWPRTAGVYFAAAGDRVKIGTAKNIAKRLRVGQTFAAHRLDLLAIAPGAEAEERELHDRFADDRLHGEWFVLTDQIVQYARELRWRADVQEA